jgi:hypothetical protein
MKLKDYCSKRGMLKHVALKAGIHRATLSDMIKRDRVPEKYIDRLIEATDAHCAMEDLDPKARINRGNLIPVYTHTDPDPIGVKKYRYEILRNGKYLLEVVSIGRYQDVLEKAKTEIEKFTKREYGFLGISWQEKDI